MDNILHSSLQNLRLRFATENDTELILSFIKDLAKFEKLTNEVSVTLETLNQSLFKKNKVAEVIIAEYHDKPAGFALFFHNFSTFLGKAGIYLEDLFVKSEFRGNGIGKELLSCLARIAVKRDCGRLEWSVLDWNKDAIRFYKNVGAKAMDEWTVYRLSNDSLSKIAQGY